MMLRAVRVLCALTLLATAALAGGPFSIQPIQDPKLAKDIAFLVETLSQGGSNSGGIYLGQLHYKGHPLTEVKFPIAREVGIELLKSQYSDAAEYVGEADNADIQAETGRQTHRWLQTLADDYTTGTGEPDEAGTQKKNRATLKRLFASETSMKGWGISQSDSGLTVSATLLVDYRTGRVVFVEHLQFP